MNPWLCVILGFCLTFSTWLEPSKLFAQECAGCDDNTLWTYPYDPGDFLLTVPWSSKASRDTVLVILIVGLGCIAGMIAGNVAAKNNNKHHHHHHKDDQDPKHKQKNNQPQQPQKSVRSPGIGFSF